MESPSQSPNSSPQRSSSSLSRRTSRVLPPKSYAQASGEGLLKRFSYTGERRSSNASNQSNNGIMNGSSHTQSGSEDFSRRSGYTDPVPAFTNGKSYADAVGDTPDKGITPKDLLDQQKDGDQEEPTYSRPSSSLDDADLNQILAAHRKTHAHLYVQPEAKLQTKAPSDDAPINQKETSSNIESQIEAQHGVPSIGQTAAQSEPNTDAQPDAQLENSELSVEQAEESLDNNSGTEPAETDDVPEKSKEVQTQSNTEDVEAPKNSQAGEPEQSSVGVDPLQEQALDATDLGGEQAGDAIEKQESRPDSDVDAQHDESSTAAETQAPVKPEKIDEPNGSGAMAENSSDSLPEPETAQLEKKFEKSDGSFLTSTKKGEAYETSLVLDKKEMKRPKHRRTDTSDLVSGRKAGDGWHQSTIRFAPLNIPLQRRLQTGMVLLHGLSIAGLLAIFFILCAVPLLWPLLVPYLIYCLFSTASTSGELSHRSERLRRAKAWSLFASYYPARLYRSQELPPTRKYLFGYHPHGIISHGAFAAFATEALGFSQLFPGITNTLLTLDSNFRVPIYRDYALAMGLASVSRESCENLLSKGGPNGEGMGRAITIVVGGARESLDAVPNTLKLVLNRRKGFVKLAIRTGADLVPVIGFGENDLYDQLDSTSHPWIHRGQLIMKKFLGFTVPLFHARGIWNYDAGAMPYRRPLNIVVGCPIQVEQRAKPDDAYINKIHEQYTTELLRLYDAHKDAFAPNRIEDLQIVE